MFGTCDLCYQVIELVHNPVPKENNGGQNFQDVATEFTRQLILCWMPFSASKCQSIKWHLILHWLWYLKQMGGFSDERTLEKELGILFKKPYKMTNHHGDHNDQMAMRTSMKQVLTSMFFCPQFQHITYALIHLFCIFLRACVFCKEASGVVCARRCWGHVTTILGWDECEECKGPPERTNDAAGCKAVMFGRAP